MSRGSSSLERRLKDAQAEIGRRVAEAAPDQRLRVLKESLLLLLPPEYKDVALTLYYLQAMSMDQEERQAAKDEKRAKAGGAGLVLVFIAASIFKQPNLPQLALIAVGGGLAAGLVGAWIPGALQLTRKGQGGALKATGAAAMAVLVLLLLFALMFGANGVNAVKAIFGG